MKEHVMPIQPIENGRFIPNRIVERCLEKCSINLNDIATMDFTDQERMQFAQLIGYSVSGFGGLSYVDNETYESACTMADGCSEADARLDSLRDQIKDAKEGLKKAACALFPIHPDDLV